MTNNDKKLLLKDLCSRLPYGVKGTNANGMIVDLDHPTDYSPYMSIKNAVLKHDWKPYLFPLSSMTEKQRKEYEDAITYHGYIDGGWAMVKDFANDYVIPYWFVDFCNKNHFDYRGLIEKGLAIDATGLNIY